MCNFVSCNSYRTRKGDARSIAAARSGVQGLSNEEGGEVTEAQSGDVVEYPLSVVVKAQHQDSRNKGVGLVVSRNKGEYIGPFTI
jgi:hypothetical protein